MAFVVAIAGMILPAICLMSNLDFVAIPNTIDRKFAPAVTKSKVSSSSLSNVIVGSAESPLDDVFIPAILLLNRPKLQIVSEFCQRIRAGPVPIPENRNILLEIPYSLPIL
jgi:hypothetical protein